MKILSSTLPPTSLRSTLVSLLLLALLSISAPTALSFDACGYLSYKLGLSVGPAKLSEYRACLRTIPFHTAEAKSLINTFWKVLGRIYPYANIVKNYTAGTPYDTSVDIKGGLLAIGKKAYKSDYDFQNDMISLVKSLNDGHTEWNPSCYSSIVGEPLQPFPIYMVSNATTKTSKLLVAPLDAMIAAESTGYPAELVFRLVEAELRINISDYAGAEVVKINGVNALTYAVEVAKTIGGYRDPQARLNSLFLRPSAFPDIIMLGEFFAPSFLPARDSIKFTFKKQGSATEETLDVPYYIVYSGRHFTNSSTFYTVNCKANTNTTAVFGAATVKESRPKMLGMMLRPKKNATMRARAATTSSTPTLLSGPYAVAKAYLLADKVTGVLVIPDFSGTFDYSGYYETSDNPYLDVFVAYELIRNSTAKRLIIYLSENPGGSSVLATLMRSLLFPSTTDVQYLLQYKAPAIVQHAALVVQKGKAVGTNYSFYSDPGFVDPYTNKPFSKPSNFFFPLVNLTQSGITDTFSSYFKFYANFTQLVDDYYYPYTDYELPTTQLFEPKDILIVSNGLCFSTCAIFASEMQDLGVRVVSTGGLPSEGSFSPSSGTAGFVVTSYLSYYEYNIYYLGLQKAAHTLALLPERGSFRFTLAQALRTSSLSVPLEFEYRKANYSLPYTESNVLDPYQIWKEAAKFF
eukprot:TRINITY_DN270_c0_g1_i1.p1 TRINITY_DN270_c0_g1~~TRINITY_DN270_c0_g1_i1.p1  ORF type:complete len:689 (-),score=45.31 TRINITY_DN270_c0_g1_i1:490-2556(-)